MKTDKLLDAMGLIDDKIIASASKVRKKKNRPKWHLWAAAAYDAWMEDRTAQLGQPDSSGNALDGFFAATIRQFLSEDTDKNRVFSPANVYMALSMLAEVTDGESREQILSLLNQNSIEDLRTQASQIWNASYCKDGAVTSVLANSLWLNQDIRFNQSTLDTLAKNYYASSYQGKMGSEELNEALQKWLNEQTDGLLKEQVSELEMNSETLLALASTIYFQAKWAHEFWEGETSEDTFHAPGGDISCDFMHQSSSKTYYWSDKFSAVAQELEGSGSMWLILPDEGVSPQELLSDPKTMDLFLSDEEWTDSKYLTVNLAMPKFDVASDIDLSDQLKALGITDIFDAAAADFSPMTTDPQDIYVSQAKHAARVTVDEEGCTATAFTAMMMTGSGMPPDEEVDFTLNRPFLFVITGESGLPLFAGLVNQPM